MADQNSESFKSLIKKNLEQNGFPLKKVSLPLEKMYEAADKREVNLNLILKELENEGIIVDKTLDKIIFSIEVPGNQEDMMKQAQEMMKNMTPEQIQEIRNMFENMSPEEKAEIMKKGAELGFK